MTVPTTPPPAAGASRGASGRVGPAATPPPAAPGDVLLRVEGLDVDLAGRTGGRVRVLDDVSFEVPRGRVVGIVGESGSGKTMLLRALLDLLPAGAGRSWDRVVLDGADITSELPR